MRKKVDFNWMLEQIEKHMAKNHSPASNIMNIITEVRNRAIDKSEVESAITMMAIDTVVGKVVDRDKLIDELNL